MINLKGIEVSNKIKLDIENKLKDGLMKIPTLAIVRIGQRPDDVAYERGAVKKMTSFGLRTELYTFSEDIGNDDFVEEFLKINSDSNIDGILLLRPLPKSIDEHYIETVIDPKKDVDGISPINMAKIMMSDKTGSAPCTAQAVIEMLDGYDIAIAGKRVVIIGRSLVIGKPLSLLMLARDATVTICHSKTANLKEVCKEADILVAAIGRAKMIDASYIKKDAIVIDVGINMDAEGKLCGDVDYESASTTAAMITPVPGGIGTVTTAVLAKHLMSI